MPTSDDLEILSFADAAEWEAWLAHHHADRPGVWVRIARKGSGLQSINAVEGTEVALCFGWIDSHRKAFDETRFLQKYTPRRRGSAWSRVNRDRAEALIATGRMQAAGLAEIERAQTDGRWAAAYESQREAVVPLELENALAANTEARRAFEALRKTDRYGLILPLLKARTEADRARQLGRIIETLLAGVPR